ncbi:hypothetical protein HanIR_Chr01g0045181 [Helianthus annuus]|nr:hypothetical protein HanIR_Chr01g0045181 [Helianthus annuus]
MPIRTIPTRTILTFFRVPLTLRLWILRGGLHHLRFRVSNNHLTHSIKCPNFNNCKNTKHFNNSCNATRFNLINSNRNRQLRNRNPRLNLTMMMMKSSPNRHLKNSSAKKTYSHKKNVSADYARAEDFRIMRLDLDSVPKDEREVYRRMKEEVKKKWTS